MTDWIKCDVGEYECWENDSPQFFLEVGGDTSVGATVVMSPAQALQLGQTLLAWAQPKFTNPE